MENANEVRKVAREIAVEMLAKSVEYVEKEDAILNPFEYAACYVSASLEAWVKMMVAIGMTKEKQFSKNELANLGTELCAACLHDALESVSNNLKTK